MGKSWDRFDIERMEQERKKYEKGHKASYNHKSMAAGKYSLSLSASRQFQEWTQMWGEHVYRVLKPGAYLVAFASPRTYHRMVCGLEDAGFEIRDHIFWVFASGFPKSSNQKGEWAGWGSALKPAHEPIVIARKPLIGSIPENLARYGTGAMNIDACRIQGEPWSWGSQPVLNNANFTPGITGRDRYAENIEGGDKGRWPANLIHDGSEEVLKCFPDAPGQMAAITGNEPTQNGFSGPTAYSGFRGRISTPEPRQELDKSAARFFYCAKTSRTDRNEGCEDLPVGDLNWSSGDENPGSFQSENTDRTSPNNHPTVKPTPLMRYLTKLVTRKGGHVLDPFCGSGSTGKAALLEHMNFTGIDMDPHHITISGARCRWALKNRDNQTNLFT
jgi:site-specific DNA-methyltransferase (adenine-specific)